MSETAPIDAIGTLPDSNSGPALPVENPGASLDRDAFLKLLVAQLKYQDPTKPADTSQMLAQSAQLTMVERLDELTAAYQASAASQQLSLAGTIVGRQISFLDEDATPVTALVESAQVTGNDMLLIADGYAVPFDAVVAVHAPAPEPTPVPAPPTEFPAADEPTV